MEEGIQMDIRNGVALVTGGRSGLGAATVNALVEAGARVVVLDLARDGVDLPDTWAGSVEVVAGDVRDERDVLAALDRAEQLGPLRAVVNCAGIGEAAKTVSRDGSPYSLASFERVISVNLIGTFNVIRLGAARMAANDPQGGECGVIVNTASVAAFDGQMGQAAYAASKAGVAGMTLPVARDLAKLRIRVVTLAPGVFETPMMGVLSEAARASLAEQFLHPARLGDPAEYAALVAHVIANPMLNAEVIRLDGGMRMGAR